MGRATDAIGQVFAAIELIGGLFAGLWGTAEAVRITYLELSVRSCVVEGTACVRDLGGSIAFGAFLLLSSVLATASAYAHARQHRLIGLAGLWILAALFYLFVLLSWGAAFGVPFLLTLLAALAGTLRLPFPRRPSSRGSG